MAGTKLLPCPFCGGKAHIWNSGYFYNGKCYKCGCTLSGNGYVTEAEAVEAWNKRAGCKDCAALNRAAGLWAKADKRARELERTCRMTPSDYYPCAEDDCMRLSMRMWMCSECEADYVGSKPNYCPNCGAKVVDA